MYGTPKTFLSQATKGHKAAPTTQFEFARTAEAATAATSGTALKKLSVQMSQSNNPRWAWDESSQTFLRSEGTTAAKDSGGDQLSATNVVVLTVKIETTKYKDPAGTAVPETVVVGSGKALVASGGKVVEAEWSKKKQSSPIVLTVNGESVDLAPGNTWVELMPSTEKWTVSS